MLRQLNANGANTAASNNDQDALAFMGTVSIDPQPVKNAS
jgi:hypothetical protein